MVTAGDSAGAEITGTAPNQTINLTLPKGDTGDACSLSIGTVEDGDSAGAEITGTAPNQTLNLTLPKGDKGDTGGTFSILQVAELPEIVDSSTLYLIG